MRVDVPTHSPLSDAAVELVAQRFKILGDATRLKILRRLMEGEQHGQCAGGSRGQQSGQCLAASVRALNSMGMVSKRKAGLNAYYAIADPNLHSLCDLVCSSMRQELEKRVDYLA
jgi:DNA-binding HxlR family transcriptional regulator